MELMHGWWHWATYRGRVSCRWKKHRDPMMVPMNRHIYPSNHWNPALVTSLRLEAESCYWTTGVDGQAIKIWDTLPYELQEQARRIEYEGV